jgi:uncharacterized protein (DUF2141 family)
MLGPIDRDGCSHPQPVATATARKFTRVTLAGAYSAIRCRMRGTLTLATLASLALSFLSQGRTAHAETSPACGTTDAKQVSLEISVTGMHSAKGNITITIYPDDPSHFLDGAYKTARQQLPVSLPVTSACFTVAAPGYYAVALFHDENDNHHFDTNSLGIPTEGYGFSNNPTLYFGPPDLSRVRFSVHSGDNPIAIQMKYY